MIWLLIPSAGIFIGLCFQILNVYKLDAPFPIRLVLLAIVAFVSSVYSYQKVFTSEINIQGMRFDNVTSNRLTITNLSSRDAELSLHIFTEDNTIKLSKFGNAPAHRILNLSLRLRTLIEAENIKGNVDIKLFIDRPINMFNIQAKSVNKATGELSEHLPVVR